MKHSTMFRLLPPLLMLLLSLSSSSKCTIVNAPVGGTPASSRLTREASLSLKMVHRSEFIHGSGDHQKLLQDSLSRDAQRLLSIQRRLEASTGMPASPTPSSTLPSDVTGPVTSGLSFGSGEYFVRLSLGTPPKPMYMVVDTGSDVSWVQCVPCKRCYHQVDTIFDPRNSTTFQPVGCTSQQCRQLDIHGCGNKGTRCIYQVSYGDGSFTMGTFATESFTFGGSGANGSTTTSTTTTSKTVLTNIAFGCGFDNEGLFVGAGGLLGLGNGKLSFITQLGTSGSFPKKFSYCLVPRASANTSRASASSLMLGANSIPSSGASFTPLLKNPKLATFYYMSMVGITVGNYRLPISVDKFKLSESGSGGVIIDSGTAVTRLTTPIYVALRDAFRNATSKFQPAPKFSLFDTCYNFSKMQTVDVPALVFHFEGGADLRLPPPNYMVAVDKVGTFCLALAPTPMMLSIIGNIQQQGFRIGFDVQNYQIAFAPQQCS